MDFLFYGGVQLCRSSAAAGDGCRNYSAARYRHGRWFSTAKRGTGSCSRWFSLLRRRLNHCNV